MQKQMLGMKVKRERVVMDMEAVILEHASTESQLTSLRSQIDGLYLELEEQQVKVYMRLNRWRKKIVLQR